MSSDPLPAEDSPSPPPQPAETSEPYFSSGERHATRLSITDLRVTREDVAVRMKDNCVDVRGKSAKWPSGCSHMDWCCSVGALGCI